MGRGTSAVDHGGEARAEAGRARWAAAVEARTVIFTEGAVIERLRRDRRFELDPHAAHAPFIYTPRGQGALEDLWRGYAAPIRQAGFPVIVCAPTWRASPERLRRANLPDVATVSRDAVALLARWRSTCGDDGPPIFMGALLGCRGDAYRPEEALDARSAAEYHRPQAEALAEAGPDLLLASTLPAFSEALGLAQALAATGRSYGLSFVLRPSGTLLDGSPLAEAVARIDDAVAPAPTFYLGGCVHPVHFERALAVAAASRPSVVDRLIGLQGNGSRKAPEELDGSRLLDADDPLAFADAMEGVRRRFGLRILGGCCGTDERHLAAAARRVRAGLAREASPD